MARDYVPVIDYYSIESPIATELRRLLNNIKSRGADRELKSVLLTSATTGEGKSTVSTLLSITSARKGFKTLFVDCDLRRPTVHKLFAVERQHGLVEALTEGLPAKSIIKKTALENLDLITAGQTTAVPTEVFDAKAIGAMINEQKFYYDFIFLDTPPVIPVSDPMLLAQESDGALLVIKAGVTAREVVARASDIMTSNSNNLLGVVLNNVKGSLPYYYDYSNYKYDYSPKASDKRDSFKNAKSVDSSGSSGRKNPKASNDKQVRR